MKPQHPAFYSIALTVFLFGCISVIGQPGYDSSRDWIRVNEIRTQIQKLDRAIADAPKQAGLRGRRGLLYVELYKRVHFDAIKFEAFGEWSRQIPPELAAEVLENQAIRDLDRAIASKPAADVYAGRGKIIAWRYERELRFLDWSVEMAAMNPAEWRDFLPTRTADHETAVLRKVLALPSFEAAAKSLRLSLKAKPAEDAAREINNELAKLFYQRATYINNRVVNVGHLIVGTSPEDYSVWSDFDTSIAYATKADFPESSISEWRKSRTYDLKPLLLSNIYLEKAYVARRFGRNDLVLSSLGAAEALIDLSKKTSLDRALFYSLRSHAMVDLGMFDEALAALDKAMLKSMELDRLSYGFSETRGDAYFGKEDFAAAITEYSEGIEKNDTGSSREIYGKRGIAYLRSGNEALAIEDLTRQLAMTGPSSSLLNSRAEAFRAADNNTEALADETRASEIKKRKLEAQAAALRKQAVYGKIVMPNGEPVSYRNALILLRYSDGTKATLPFDEMGRFELSGMKPLSFFIFAYNDTEVNGVMKRHYVRTPEILPKEDLIGPVILVLDKSVLKGAVN